MITCTTVQPWGAYRSLSKPAVSCCSQGVSLVQSSSMKKFVTTIHRWNASSMNQSSINIPLLAKSPRNYNHWLVVWTPPLWKIGLRQLGWWFPIWIWENEKCSKPPTRSLFKKITITHYNSRKTLIVILIPFITMNHSNYELLHRMNRYQK